MRAEAPAAAPVWDALRARVRSYTAGLTVVPPAGPGRCTVCQRPVPGPGRCFQCGLHAESAPGMLADAVVPVAYASKGSRFAGDLWRYKSGRPGAQAAGVGLLAMLLVFLHDHADCIWRRAGMPAPSHVAVVPSSRGRPGPHPLERLVFPCLRLPRARLRALPGADPYARTLDPQRFRAPVPLPGANVLVLDDTWTSGSSAQSAAMILKRAGARSVAVVVLGRHMAAAEPGPATAAGPRLGTAAGPRPGDAGGPSAVAGTPGAGRWPLACPAEADASAVPANRLDG